MYFNKSDVILVCNPWVTLSRTLCGYRQRKLEESLLFSGQFKDALQALLGWLCKIEPFISDEQNVHGDLDTVTKLSEQQKVSRLSV